MKMRTKLVLGLLVYSALFSYVVYGNELSLVVAESSTLHLSPRQQVENSPGSKPGTLMVCERVQIHGLSRVRNLKKFAHSLKVKVSYVNSSARLPNIEVCFHRNASLELGMCPQGQWEKLVKGSWVRSMSPFDHKILDTRMAAAGSSLGTVEVSIEEEFFLYRIVFLVLGILMMALASSLSNSLVFYYSSAMAVGIILVVLMVLFQGMKLLPTGRKNSLVIFVYSSVLGVGSFLLRYLPRLLRSVLVEIGIGEDMYYPLALFLVVFLLLVGAWLGFWVVRKLVLTEEGLIDMSVAQFVAWSMRIFGAVMILQSTVDPLLAVEALLCGVLILSILRRIMRPKFYRYLYKKISRTDKSSHRRSSIPDSTPVKISYDKYSQSSQWPEKSEFQTSQSRLFSMVPCKGPLRGSTSTPGSQLSGSNTFYSTFHHTPESRKFSKDEWKNFTKDSTKTALEELVSSPDFSKWAVANAERITLTPTKDAANHGRGWFPRSSS